MDHYPSSHPSKDLVSSSQSSARDYQSSNEYRAPGPSGTFRSPSQYSEWSMASSTDPEWMSNDFDISPLSTCSQTIQGAPVWDLNYNPFDSSFSKYSVPNGVGALSVDYENAQQAWLASPQTSTEQSPTSSQHMFSPPTIPLDTNFSRYDSAPYVDVDRPMSNLPINTIPSRTHIARKSKPSSKGISKERRPSTKTYRQRQQSPTYMIHPDGQITTHQHRPQHQTQQTESFSNDDEECTNSTTRRGSTSTSSKSPPTNTSSSRMSTTKNTKEEDDKERHKHVEMKYRMQMKDRFEDLLSSLPEQMSGPLIGEANSNPNSRKFELDKKMTRGKVLDLAKEHIDSLNKTNRMLEEERDMLRYKLNWYETAFATRGMGICGIGGGGGGVMTLNG